MGNTVLYYHNTPTTVGWCQLMSAGQDAVHPYLERGERIEGREGNMGTEG